ncbi:MAG: RICIN domain-containing protein [Pseudolabrys sp.]|nr:RICIN domain-containing protein [Pseudolabrys sp.]
MFVRPIVLAVLICLLAPLPAAAGEPVVKGTFHTILMLGDSCITAPQTAEPYLRPGKRLELRPCRNSAEQQFEWNVITFEIKFQGLCVDALRVGTGPSQPGDPIGLWHCQNNGHQQWYPDNKNRNWLDAFNIVGGSPSSTLCLTADNGNGEDTGKGEDGAPIAMRTCSNDDNQWFRLREWPPLKASPVSQRDGLISLVAATAATVARNRRLGLSEATNR